MKIVFLGKQGSGKGTQAKMLSKELEIPHISTGDLLRGSTGDLKKKVDEYINNGNLVPDSLIFKILDKRFQNKDCEKGFILDGLPRNLNQARELDKIVKIEKVFEIFISDREAIKRLGSRLNCKNCGAVFNKETNPPKKEGLCDVCGGEIYQREDDKEQAIKKRLEIYNKQTSEVLKYYGSKIIKIEGEQPIKKVFEDILAEIE